MFDVTIIGCGIIGAAAAYELSRYHLKVAVLEKENDVACGTTKANSAIIHAGYDPAPGTLMARLNVEGAALTAELCNKLDVPHRRCGALVVALSPEELPELERLYKQGLQNGVPELALLNSAEAKAREPNLSDTAEGALLAPTTMIVSPWEYALALIETAVRNGVRLRRQCEVTGIRPLTGGAAGWALQTGDGVIHTRFVVNAAGVNADTIHNMVSAPAFRITPDRGAYYLLDKSEGDRVRHVVFQCPTKLGKGTLVAPTVHGNLIVGPNNEQPADPEDVAVTPAGLAEVAANARRSVPSVDLRQSIRNFAGVRAATDKDDFLIAPARGAPGFVDLAGIKSPGLSAAPAIAKMAVEMLREAGLRTIEQAQFIDTRRRTRFAELPVAEKRALILQNPDYGRIICRCESVTEGEILDALAAPIPPRSVDAVKRRCGAGMGRCQGGFCGPRIVQLLSERLGVKPTEIPQDLSGSRILIWETKGDHTEGAMPHVV